MTLAMAGLLTDLVATARKLSGRSRITRSQSKTCISVEYQLMPEPFKPSVQVGLKIPIVDQSDLSSTP